MNYSDHQPYHQSINKHNTFVYLISYSELNSKSVHYFLKHHVYLNLLIILLFIIIFFL